MAQWLEHCVSSAKVVGSIPREHMYWQKKCITWMHCKSLWKKVSAKCINIKYKPQCYTDIEYYWFVWNLTRLLKVSGSLCQLLQQTHLAAEQGLFLAKTTDRHSIEAILAARDQSWLIYSYSDVQTLATLLFFSIGPGNVFASHSCTAKWKASVAKFPPSSSHSSLTSLDVL